MCLPIKVFEVSDVVYKDDKSGNFTSKNHFRNLIFIRINLHYLYYILIEVGAVNKRYICAIYYGKSSGFEIIHGLLNKIMQLLNIPKDFMNGYYIRSTNGIF